MLVVEHEIYIYVKKTASKYNFMSLLEPEVKCKYLLRRVKDCFASPTFYYFSKLYLSSNAAFYD